MTEPAIERAASIESTNKELLDRAGRGEALVEGQWLIADRQTAGRGRMGREWIDGSGNFMGSTVVSNVAGDPSTSTLAFVFALAAHDALADRVADLALKWPNDVLAGGSKIAGILLQQVNAIVVAGLGVNIAQAPDLAKTTSLADRGIADTRDAFFDRLRGSVAVRIADWRARPLSETLRAWMDRGPEPGARLAARGGEDAPLEGRYDGLADDGGLRLRLDDGTMRVIHAGEVSLMGA